jgi:hypothetical protein
MLREGWPQSPMLHSKRSSNHLAIIRAPVSYRYFQGEVNFTL